MKFGWVALAAAAMISTVCSAQVPTLTCAINYKGKLTPLNWFAPSGAHLGTTENELVSAMLKEKSEPGKYELSIIEAVDDPVWENLVKVVEASDLDQDSKTKMRQIGRTRTTTVFLGLYKGIIQYQQRLGTDPNQFEVSCRQLDGFAAPEVSEAPAPNIKPPFSSANGVDI